MSGVEAAASLFGSDEPGSDPFASLGADTSFSTPADNLFLGESDTSYAAANGDSFDIPSQNDTFPAAESTYPSYSSSTTTAVSAQHDPYAQPQNAYTAQSYQGGYDYALGSNYAGKIPPPW